MKLKLPGRMSISLSSEPVAASSRVTKALATSLGIVICLGFLSSHRAESDEIDLGDIPPQIYEWHPYEPTVLAVKDELVLFGDVDDFGGGVYTCIWESDGELLDIQTVEFSGEDWINFKTRIAYRPKNKDVGTHTITLTVEDPEGHTDEETYIVEVSKPLPAAAARKR